ncbi:MAG: alpha-galactosidase [Oscillospiraceae bacterium]|nr:alpha-galactosidase [Oscillospiraceae bacterium]
MNIEKGTMRFGFKCSENVKVTINSISDKDGIALYELKAVYSEEQIPEKFTVTFAIPDADIYSVWSPSWTPSSRFDRRLGPNWAKRASTSRLAAWMPLHGLVSADGKNRIMLALSDAKTPLAIRTGVREETANVEWEIDFFTIKVAPLKEYSTIIRIDTRDIAYYDSVYDVVNWWENECGYAPAYIPEHAKLPMNSLWYSYHQQLDVDDIIKECELSKALGMDTVIIDDGWQTDDNGRGYRFCGDWEPAPAKIPDMKQFVDRIHATGMKVILWYAVPFVGDKSKAYTRFSDMLLDETGNNSTHWAFDPRYKEVREYLIETFTRGLKEWGLDGLKLDFIDTFALKGKSLEYDARRDYQSIEDAVDRLMTDVTDALRAIKPDVLIEFRQSYVGPAIRKYGNMFRVGDCPNDAFTNRQEIVDLRFTSGNTAVHSDMIMWSMKDDVESAALQFANILYSVPQISVKIATLPDDHKKMLEYYLRFWKENKDTLMEGKILAANPESSYSLVCAEKDGKAIFTSYTDIVIDCKAYNEIVAVNCSRSKTLILKNAAGKLYNIVNCMGETVSEGKIDSNLSEVKVPKSGMIFVK